MPTFNPVALNKRQKKCLLKMVLSKKTRVLYRHLSQLGGRHYTMCIGEYHLNIETNMILVPNSKHPGGGATNIKIYSYEGDELVDVWIYYAEEPMLVEVDKYLLKVAIKPHRATKKDLEEKERREHERLSVKAKKLRSFLTNRR